MQIFPSTFSNVHRYIRLPVREPRSDIEVDVHFLCGRLCADIQLALRLRPEQHLGCSRHSLPDNLCPLRHPFILSQESRRCLTRSQVSRRVASAFYHSVNHSVKHSFAPVRKAVCQHFSVAISAIAIQAISRSCVQLRIPVRIQVHSISG